MEQFRNITVKHAPWKRDVLIAMEIIFIIMTVYFLIAFSYFILKVRKSKPMSVPHGSRNALFWFLFVLLFFGLLKFSTVLYATYERGDMTAAHCDLIERTYQIITGLALTFLYSFLWLRQYTIYKEPILRTLVSPCLAKVNKYFIFVILLTCLVAAIAVFLTGNVEHHRFLNDSGYCVFTTIIDANTYAIYASYVIIASWHVFILFLFIHILKRHQSDLASHHVDVCLCSSSYAKFGKRIRNCTIAVATMIITDVITLILDTKLPSSLPQPFFLFVWDVSYVINLSCVLLCFASWRSMVFPWRHKKAKTQTPKLIKMTVIPT